MGRCRRNNEATRTDLGLGVDLIGNAVVQSRQLGGGRVSNRPRIKMTCERMTHDSVGAMDTSPMPGPTAM